MTTKRTIPIIMAMLLALTLSGCPAGTKSGETASTPATAAPAPAITPTAPSPSDTTATPSPSASRPTVGADLVARIDGSTATIPLMTAALRLLRGTDDGMQFNKTSEAYDNLIAGRKDVIFVTAPSAEELAAAKDAGIELEVIPVVKDALVFLNNTANPVQALTRQQIQDVYSGKVTNWGALGGADKPIIAYQRPINSGSQTLFLQLAMTAATPMDAPASIRPGGMDGLMDVISAYDNSASAIGFSVFYYTQEMYVKDNVRLLAIDQVAPTRETIADGSYPYLTYYYAVVRKDEPAGSPARQLIDWCLSAEGQRTFSAASYVPLDPANIVAPDDGYGYQGSTAENTTQSSGTGGPAGQMAAFGADVCTNAEGTATCIQTDDNGRYLGITVPGFPQAETAAKAWFEALPPAPTYVPTIDTESDYQPVSAASYWAASSRGLLTVTRTVNWAGFEFPAISTEAAVFRLADGHRMQLSDFFYDGVNYIDFINRNILNEATNQELLTAWQSGEVGERTAPFTGLPATTLDFYPGAGQLVFRFAAGNPFLSQSLLGVPADSYVPLNLPSDLSPYGGLWRTTPVKVGNFTIDHVVRNYAADNGTDPRDATLNAAIDAWVTGHDQGSTAITSITSASATGLVVWVNLTAPNQEYASYDYVDSAEFDFMTGEGLN